MLPLKDSWIDDCRAACKKVKSISRSSAWDEKPSNSNYLIAEWNLLDNSGAIIPHLYSRGEYTKNKYGEILRLAIMYRRQKEQYRVFMLEVYPPHVRSHVDHPSGEIFFGPHMHLGSEKLDQLVKLCKTKIDDVLSDRWIKRFIRHTTIQSSPQKKLSMPPINPQKQLFE
ncbi:hypothetical protein AKN92_11410 [Thiopseudomonas alkaliphila]|nr:hypothetical protein AKN92_11410 [Thiopseudomonas alkaliphila]